MPLTRDSAFTVPTCPCFSPTQPLLISFLSLSGCYNFLLSLSPPSPNIHLALPSSFLFPAAVGIQMQADYLQHHFWAAMQQVGQLGAQKRAEDSTSHP